MINKFNQNGITILELLVSIVVGSIVTMILMQILVMTVGAKAQMDTENKMLNESYYIAEQIRSNIFDLQPQEIELITDDDLTTEIHIRHLYDITTDATNTIIRDTSNPITDKLIFDKVNEKIYYVFGADNTTVQINDPSITITTGSMIELISIDPDFCNLDTVPCDQGIIKLTLTISVTLQSGSRLLPQTYVTTILV